MTSLEDKIFNIDNDDTFERVALEVFQYQYKNVPIYTEYVDQLKRSTPTSINEIPFLPISFFKTHEVIATGKDVDVIFKSSGTGGDRSKHFVHKSSVYEQSFEQSYRNLIGEIEDQVILALLPNYLEQGDSSLVYMVDHLIRKANPLSGFVLNEGNELITRYSEAVEKKKQVIIIGVSYALLDLIDQNIKLPGTIILETGGMKGRRKELTKTELHEALSNGLQCNNIWSEYGMTELLSQAYSESDMLFRSSPWMKVLIRDTNDPFTFLPHQKTGGINVIDLANLYSCSFIATQDLGKTNEKGFEILGRFDNADLRGCNLLVQ